MGLGFGGHSSTPTDLNTFIRGYVGGKLFDQRTRQSSEGSSRVEAPNRPAREELGRPSHLPLRDALRDGVGPHGEHLGGYTQFAAASADGKRSVTVSINAQHTLDGTGSLAVLQGAEACGGPRRVRRAGRQLGRGALGSTLQKEDPAGRGSGEE